MAHKINAKDAKDAKDKQHPSARNSFIRVIRCTRQTDRW